MVVPEHLSEAINKIQDTILICPPVVSQYATLGALQVGKSYPLEQLKTISQVREICLNALESIGDICDVATAEGAFYFFLKITTDKNDFQLVKSLIEQAAGGGVTRFNFWDNRRLLFASCLRCFISRNSFSGSRKIGQRIALF
jgi:aspartate/methionine/tyrosine aminotransferase